MKKLIAITIGTVLTLSGICVLPQEVHADSISKVHQKECCIEKHEKVDEVRAIISTIQLKTYEAIMPSTLEFSAPYSQEHENKFKETTSNSPPKNLLTGTTIKLE
jgi:hypothetical protein